MSDATQSSPTRDSFNDPEYREAVIDLLGGLAYGELTAFSRLAGDAELAPTLEGKAALARMAASEFGHYERIERRLRELGVEPREAMEPFVAAIDAFHDRTSPSTWLEGLVKAYVGDGIASDFYREISVYVDPGDPGARRLGAGGPGAQRVRRQRGARRDRGRPVGLGTPGPVGPPAGRRGALAGPAGGGRARCAHVAAGRRRQLLRRGPGRAGPDVRPADRRAHRADAAPRPHAVAAFVRDTDSDRARSPARYPAPLFCSDQLDRAEADPASLGGADLDVAEHVGRDDDDPALVVDQLERAAGGQRCVHGRGDLLGRLRRLQRDLARDVANADLDLHGHPSSSKAQSLVLAEG